jgi:spermidine/putrescine transport system ATP-binding protein
VHVAIRPEHVQLGGSIRATIKDVVFQGSFKRVMAALAEAPDISLLARLPADAPVAVDAQVSLQVDPDRVLVLKG